MKKVKIDDDVLDIWVGTKNEMNEKVKKDEFNVCAFMLGGVYYIYRKMYLIGIIDLVLSIIGNVIIAVIGFFIGIVISFKISSFFILVVPIINGFLFCPLYKMHIRNVLKKRKYQNINQTQIAKNKGGVNKIAATIIGIIAIILMLCISYYLLLKLTYFVLEARVSND